MHSVKLVSFGSVFFAVQAFASGDLQLSHTMYRFTDLQDVRLVLGCRAYADHSAPSRSPNKSLVQSLLSCCGEAINLDGPSLPC